MTEQSPVSQASEPFLPPFVPPIDGMTMSLPKMALVAGLALATIVPNYFISALVAERETRQDAVQSEFARIWGPQQTLHSPILILPYQTGPDRPRQYLKIVPAKLGLVADLVPQQRHRGLFHATVYDARIEMQGTFSIPAESRLKELVADKWSRFLWDESFVALGTKTTFAGLKSGDHIAINGVQAPWQPCLEVIRQEQDCRTVTVVLAGVHSDPASPITGDIAFKSTVNLRGTTSLNVINAAKELDATMRSTWRTPSFGGDTLPERSDVNSRGFEAHWKVAEFGSPRISTSGSIVDPAISKGSTIGVDLIEATPIYRMINRAAKYGLLFVVLSFATYLFFEFLSRLQIHVVQYGLLGLSLSLFSLLLLSLSEPIGYTAGYVVSAGLVLIQSSLYTAAVAKRAGPALMFAAMLTSLFAFLYVLLGLETYSLLIGALALFAVVSILMLLTQRVNWSAPPLADMAEG